MAQQDKNRGRSTLDSLLSNRLNSHISLTSVQTLRVNRQPQFRYYVSKMNKFPIRTRNCRIEKQKYVNSPSYSSLPSLPKLISLVDSNSKSLFASALRLPQRKTFTVRKRTVHKPRVQKPEVQNSPFLFGWQLEQQSQY